jgi:hypothetical protein
MKVWVGLKRNDEYVHEWEGEVQEAEIANAVRNALTEYANKGEILWGLTILLDRVRPGVGVA